MPLNEINGRNSSTLSQTEIINKNGVPDAHLVKWVAAYRGDLHARLRTVNFDQGILHRIFRIASLSQVNRMESENLEAFQKNDAEMNLPRDYRRYQCFSRYTGMSSRKANKLQKNHKRIPLERRFIAQAASQAPRWHLQVPKCGSLGIQGFGVGVDYLMSCSRFGKFRLTQNVWQLEIKNIGEKWPL